jgi:hypothetical protein
LREAAGCEHRPATRVLRLHAAADVLGDLHGEMGLHLATQIIIGALVAPEERGHARKRPANRSHADTCCNAKRVVTRPPIGCPYVAGATPVSETIGAP